MGGGLAQAGIEAGRRAAGRDWEAACRCSCCYLALLVAILDRLLACHGLPAAPAATKFQQNHWSMQSSKEILPRPSFIPCHPLHSGRHALSLVSYPSPELTFELACFETKPSYGQIT